MNPTRRTFLQLSGLTGASFALNGCDAVSDALAVLIDAPPEGDFRPPLGAEIDFETHLLNRLTWGPRPGDYQRVRSMGADAFIDEQLHPENITDRRCDRKVASIESLYQPMAELYEYNEHELLQDLTRYKLLRGVYSKRQLHEVMVDFWTDHFNIVSQKDDCRWLKAEDDREVIRKHALGNFRDLVRASSLSPAMLIYLDGHANRVENPGDKPNENYARELLELHTLGVRGGYTQQDVMEVARCLSGWTYENNPFAFRASHVEFAPYLHDNGEKTVLGHTIPTGGGAEDLERVLDIVCMHPSTARYLAIKLCRRFIADVPSEEVVESTADAFLQSSGDIRTVLRTLFDSDAFRSSRGNQLKRPLRFVISALRGTDAQTNCSPAVMNYLRRMGQSPFQYPTPDGYPQEPTPWLGTLLWRWNFALALQGGGLYGTTIKISQLAERYGGPEPTAAHLLGRSLTDLEQKLLNESNSPLALMLASPAFQFY